MGRLSIVRVAWTASEEDFISGIGKELPEGLKAPMVKMVTRTDHKTLARVQWGNDGAFAMNLVMHHQPYCNGVIRPIRKSDLGWETTLPLMEVFVHMV